MHFKLFCALFSVSVVICHSQFIPYHTHPGYRGTVVRKLGNTNPVWFEAQEPSDCDVVPEQVNAGKPPRDICANAAVDQRSCICIKRAGYNVYEPICGECRDPCALKFVVDRYATSPSLAKLIEEEDENTQD
jgi:hypothetical protein